VSAPSSSDLAPAVLVLVLFVLILARRTYAQITGARFSAGRLFGFTGFYVLLFVALAFPTLYAAVDAWGIDGALLLVPYVVVPLAAAWVATPYVRRIVRFEQRDGGAWYYRLPWIVPVLYLVLFIVRFGAEILIFGLAVVSSFFAPSSVPAGLIFLLVGIDLLFGASTGLLIGRSVGVYRAHVDLLHRTAATPGPLSSGPMR
jgi:hypothetical protein